MDSFSDSSRYDLDSVTSTDSLRFIADEFRLRHSSTPDISNAELLKRLASLELENERLRVDLENSRLEINAKIASNQGLKDTITELYIEAQAALQDRLKIENALQNAKGQVVAVENSRKWYEARLHDLQASKNGLQTEIDTYRRLLMQKHEVTLTLTARCKQSNMDYSELNKKFKRERQELDAELESLRLESNASRAKSQPMVNNREHHFSPDLSTKLESTEDELRDTRVEFKAMERRLQNLEAANNSLESALVKHRELISSTEMNVRRCEMEKDEAKNRLGEALIELDKTTLERNVLQATLLTCKQEHGQVEQAMVQLKSQLNKMIAQYKLINTRNTELESKVASLQEIKNENKALKSRSFEANSSLFNKLRDSKRKIRSLEEQLDKMDGRKQLSQTKLETEISLQECLRRALERNKELTDRMKLISTANALEESIDEGYGDGCAHGVVTDIPSPAPLDPRLAQSIYEILAGGKNFLSPVEAGLEELRRKFQTFRAGDDMRLPNSGQMSPASPRNNARSVA